MTEQEKLDGNKLIAEFDGWTYHEDKTRSKRWQKWWAGDGVTWAGGDAPSFHTHWELLKPVIDKIAIIGMEAEPYDHADLNSEAAKVATLQVCVSIETVWQAVVQFIQWHNEKEKIKRIGADEMKYGNRAWE